MKIIFTIVFLPIFFCGTLMAQNSLTKFTIPQVYEDLDSLKSDLIQVHPDPFSMTSKAIFTKRFLEVKRSLIRPITLKEYYRLLSPLVAMLRDGHTSLMFPGRKILSDSSLLFPYSVNCSLTFPYIIVKDYAGDQPQLIPNGANILSINKIPADSIINKIIESTSGETNLYRLRTGSNYFMGLLLLTYFDFSGGHCEIKFRLNKKIFTQDVNFITFAHLKEQIQKKQSATSVVNVSEMIDYSMKLIQENSAAILDIKYFNDLAKFHLFLDSAFSIIKTKKIKKIIIDLRDNGGGNSQLGDELFQYISPQPFHQYEKTIIKFSALQKLFYKEQCRIDSSICNTYDFLKNQPDNHVSIINQQDVIPLMYNPLRFKGQLYLLTSNRTFSSAMNFAQCFKYYHMGKIIGEETGGQVVSFGDKLVVQLPNSKLDLSISQKKFYCIGTTNKDTHGVIPDIRTASNNALAYVLKIK